MIARNAREPSPTAKKIWLSFHLRNVGSQVIVCQSDLPSVRTTGKQL